MYKYESFQLEAASVRHAPYGILCREARAGEWVTAGAAGPLSDSKEAVEALAELCTALQLCPEHLIDVAADFIASRQPSP